MPEKLQVARFLKILNSKFLTRLLKLVIMGYNGSQMGHKWVRNGSQMVHELSKTEM